MRCADRSGAAYTGAVVDVDPRAETPEDRVVRLLRGRRRSSADRAEGDCEETADERAEARRNCTDAS